jgi:hypothetical protein
MHTTRRDVLKGISLGTGSVLLGPIIQQLQAQAAGLPLPKRFLFVVEGNGLPWDHIQPQGIERKNIVSGTYTNRKGNGERPFRELPLADLELAEALHPVNDFKDRVTILQGLSGKMTSGGHSNDFGALGACNAQGGVGNNGTPANETIDYALGRRVSSIYPQIGIGIAGKPEQGLIYNCSAAGKNKPVPTQCRPDLAFESLFGSVADGSGRKRFDTRKNLLDHVSKDIRRAESGLAGPEREKLQSYLEAFESMRERHDKLVAMEVKLKSHAPPVTDKYTSEVETDRLDAQFDIATAALVSGLTNVVTVASGAGNQYFGITFTGLGIGIGKHGIGHGGSYNGMTWDVMATKIRKFHFELIARTIRKLQSVPEGDGTMFDNTLVVYLSDAAEGHHSRCWEWPMVLIGNLGGKLKCGRYLEWPGHGAKGHRHIGNLYTTFLNAVGDNRETFGQRDPLLEKEFDQRGPCEELLV